MLKGESQILCLGGELKLTMKPKGNGLMMRRPKRKRRKENRRDLRERSK